MKAWMAPMNRSNSFQTGSTSTDHDVADRERAELPDAQGGDQREHQGAREQVAEERRARVIGLAISSTMLMKRLTGSRMRGTAG